jgi:hypothetical protein
MKNDLKWVDEEYAEEKKKLRVPSEEQVALAKMLEDCGGNYHAFATWTFAPNKHEEYGQQKNGEYFQNERLKWVGGNRIVKRIKRNGGMVMGVPGISPGWSPYAAFGAVFKAIHNDTKGLKKSRWFMCIEGSKYRNCAHGHSLHANAAHVNWEDIKARWESKYGWFKFEVVEDSKGMADYLAKQYVGKDYGKDKFKFAFSRNSREPKVDPFPKIHYRLREMIYKNEIKGAKKSKNMVGKKFYREQLKEWVRGKEKLERVTS